MDQELREILFVCSGNICRSPMAEALAADLLPRHGVEATIRSAGTLGIEDQPADLKAMQALQELDIDLSGHRSTGVSHPLLERADAIVVMEEHHAESVLRVHPGCARKIHRLWEYSDPPGRLAEIFDPVGCSLQDFLKCRDDLLECLRNWVTRRLSSPS